MDKSFETEYVDLRRGAVQASQNGGQNITPHAKLARPETTAGRQRILMCPPEHFGVDYVINPWMQAHVGKAVHELAQSQWAHLHRQLSAHAEIEAVMPEAGLPDMVFTANAGLVIGNVAVVSRFRHPERAPEERLFRGWFLHNGFAIAPWPEEVSFEGAGDALLDPGRPLIWCGYGFRSSEKAPSVLEKIFSRRSIGLRLIDPRFYHLDTCFCPLTGGWLMHFPPAFDTRSQEIIASLVPPSKRIEVDEKDAERFACNAVELEGRIIMNGSSEALQNRLRAAGFLPVTTPLSEFIRAGGAAKCLTLKLADA
jgi:N-dimethylarginine dimethylaminohydrolase